MNSARISSASSRPAFSKMASELRLSSPDRATAMTKAVSAQR